MAPDRDLYYELAKKLFGEERLSTHPVPEYMEAGEVPRYVADGCFPNLKKSEKARLEVFFFFPEKSATAAFNRSPEKEKKTQKSLSG